MGIYEIQHEGKDEETQTDGDASATTIVEVTTDGETKKEEDGGGGGDEESQSGTTTAQSATRSGVKTVATLLTVFVNGCVLGVSWDGMPSLAPTMVLEMWSLLFLFLLAYCIGTVVTMGFTAALVAEATCWLSKISGEETHIADRLAYISSYAAGVIGLVWIGSAALKFSDTNLNSTNDNFAWANSPLSHSSGLMHVVLSVGSVVGVVVVILWSLYSEFAPQVQANSEAVSASGGGLFGWILASAAKKVSFFSMARLTLADDKLLVHKV
jgi:hypothetical protein